MLITDMSAPISEDENLLTVTEYVTVLFIKTTNHGMKLGKNLLHVSLILDNHITKERSGDITSKTSCCSTERPTKQSCSAQRSCYVKH